MSHFHSLIQDIQESLFLSILKKIRIQTSRCLVLFYLQFWLSLNICPSLSVHSLHRNLCTFMRNPRMFCTWDCISNNCWQQNQELWRIHLYKVHIDKGLYKFDILNYRVYTSHYQNSTHLYILYKKPSFCRNIEDNYLEFDKENIIH